MDLQNFYRGNEFEAHSYLGAHTYWGGTTFRTFAPAAARIALISDYNDWNEIEMHRTGDGNFWEVSVEGMKAGDMYKYRIYGRDGSFDAEDCRRFTGPEYFPQPVRLMVGLIFRTFARKGFTKMAASWGCTEPLDARPYEI